MDEIRVAFTDLVRMAQCTLVIPPGGQVHPAAPGHPKIGVAHPGCIRVADLALELDAFFCPLCQWNGRVSGAWCAGQIRAARAAVDDYCSRCDLFTGYGALGVFLPPEGKDEEWLRSHCWCCGHPAGG